MSIRELFPGGRGDGAAQDAASLLAGIALPSIEPFGSDTEALAGLPDRPLFLLGGGAAGPAPAVPAVTAVFADGSPAGCAGVGVDGVPVTRMSVARGVYDAGIQALSALKGVQDALDGCRARLVARVCGAAEVEAAALSLDRWQSGVAASSAAAEVAMALGIPELTAAALEHHATALVREHPAVLAALEGGGLSWRHATIIHDEISTLRETPGATGAEAAVLEAALLGLAKDTTASSFAGKARRAREKMHPETITTRTKEAFTKRRITCDAGTDGMSWLSLHLPTVSASAIYTRCTRLARAVKADAAAAQHAAGPAGTGRDGTEHRTLAQLRADIAAILLLGQDLPTTTTNNNNSAGNTGNGNTGSNGSGAGKGSNNGNGKNSAAGKGNNSNAAGTSGAPARASGREGSFGTGSGAGSPGARAGDGCGVGFGQASAFGVTLIEAAPHYISPWATMQQAPAGNTPTPAGPESGPEPGPEAGAAGPPAAVPVEVLVGALLGDGSGYVDGVVDGIHEDPEAEYQRQLQELAGSTVLVDPPLPEALVIVTVPFLGLLGFTDEPAELVGPQGGPVPEEVARKLLGNSSSFLRVLTDPITGEALPLEPQRYTLRTAEKAVLQALAGGCYMPNCPNPVMDTDLDHLRAFEFGGTSTLANLKPACRKHHVLKHFKDDKNRHGRRRSIDEPDRHNIKLRGWTPKPTPDGRIGWITPSGAYRPPQNTAPHRPRYPKWLKNLITKATHNNRNQQT